MDWKIPWILSYWENYLPMDIHRHCPPIIIILYCACAHAWENREMFDSFCILLHAIETTKNARANSIHNILHFWGKRVGCGGNYPFLLLLRMFQDCVQVLNRVYSPFAFVISRLDGDPCSILAYKLNESAVREYQTGVPETLGAFLISLIWR